MCYNLSMKTSRWQIFLVIFLLALSAGLYYVHFLLFHDAHHIFIYLLGDIAFLPIEVLLVTFVLHELLTFRERRSRLSKMNMVIGAFFSEVGTRLLVIFSDADPRLAEIKSDLIVRSSWSDREFARVSSKLKSYQHQVDIKLIDLVDLKLFCQQKRDFLLRLLENPNLLEHETFTDLLWAVFHLAEELISRKELLALGAADARHLQIDCQRAYNVLITEWLDYQRHLKDNYPHLFSLAMRQNPFDETACPEVK
jgi:hypothetical protein